MNLDAQAVEVVRSNLEENAPVDGNGSKEEGETFGDNLDKEDDELNDKKTKEDNCVENQDTENEKAPYPWMFSMSELCKGQKMILPVEGVYYPGRIDDIHVPDL